jgi:beta-lactamase regulating signal transducer with metallopeptidase domain
MTAILVESALRGLLFAAIVGLGLSIFRVRNVPARKIAWTLVLIASLAMPFLMRVPIPAGVRLKFSWALPLRTESAPVQSPAPSARAVAAAGPAISVNFDLPPSESASPQANSTAVPAAKVEVSAPARRSLAWHSFPQMISAIYVTVAAALLLRLLIGLYSALRLWTMAEFISPLVVPEPNVRASARIPAPVTVGSGIVLPADYAHWHHSKLRMVIAHERSHVRQMDFYLQFLAGLYTALFWFSPLGWWLRHTLSTLGEAIGDRAGIEAAASRSHYAETLLEIAAIPHSSLPGVAMARSADLSRRVESMLSDQQVHRAFLEGKRRAVASLLVVPIALFAAIALVRVPAAAAQSAQQPTTPPPADTQPQKPTTGQSTPPEDQVTDANPAQPAVPAKPVAPAVPAVPATTRVPPDQSAVPPAPPAPDVLPATPDIPAPPSPGEGEGAGAGFGQSDSQSTTTSVINDSGETSSFQTNRNGKSSYFFRYHSGGDAYAIVTGPSSTMSFSGVWDRDQRAQIDKARSMANGPFLWFRHEGKEYIVTDPAIVGHLQQMYQPMQELGRQQAVLGRQQSELGMQQRGLARQQREAGDIRMPDMSKEMAELNAAIAKLRTEQFHWNDQQWADLQAKLKADENQTLSPEKMGQLQAQLGAMQAQWNSERMAEFQAKLAALQAKLGTLQGEAGTRMGTFGTQMGELGSRMGQLGAEQGRLGAEQGRLARELDEQVHKIIEQSLADGKAKPVQ